MVCYHQNVIRRTLGVTTSISLSLMVWFYVFFLFFSLSLIVVILCFLLLLWECTFSIPTESLIVSMSKFIHISHWSFLGLYRWFSCRYWYFGFFIFMFLHFLLQLLLKVVLDFFFFQQVMAEEPFALHKIATWYLVL